MEECRKGHEAHRDSSGNKRCHTCDRERYRAKHPFHNKASRLRVGAAVAPHLRGQPEKVVARRVHVTTGENIPGKPWPTKHYSTLGKTQESLFAKQEVEFEVGDGVRPKRTTCANCGSAYVLNPAGKLAIVCMDGCDRACWSCKKDVSRESARYFARLFRKPICRKCSDLNRPQPTHCKRGHEFTKENTLFSPKTNQRFCRACKRQRMREVRKRAAEKSA